MPSPRTSPRALIQRGESLLVIRYSHPRGDWYALPGGGQRNGESLTAALEREVEEETGASVSIGLLRYVRESMAGPQSVGLTPDFHQVELIFECTLGTSPTIGAAQDPGQSAVEWRTVGELRGVRFFPAALLDAIESGQRFGYLGVV